MSAPASFESELEMFRGEEEAAQRYFFGFLAMQVVPFKNQDVHRAMNRTPMFWIATRHAMLMSTFIALGRIFDRSKSRHNIDKLLKVVARSFDVLSREGLRKRKIEAGLCPEQALEYVADKHDLRAADVTEIEAAVDTQRAIFDARYRDLRHNVFAHRGISREEGDQLLAKTSIDEMKQMLGFLDRLHNALFQMYINGIKPDLTPTAFVMPPEEESEYNSAQAGEQIFRQSADVLYRLVDIEDYR